MIDYVKMGVPIVVGAAAALGVGYGLHRVYEFGERSVQSDWDRDKLDRQRQLSEALERALAAERDLKQSQKEAQDAHEQANRHAEELLAVQRARTDTLVAGLRNTAAELSKRLAANEGDSAALRECKTVGSAYQTAFGACVRRHRELGESSERDFVKARNSGLECERSYDAAEASLRSQP